MPLDANAQFFAEENIVVLTNGMCSSACNNFVTMMQDMGNVKTITLGGQPDNTGAMVGVGGVQGGVALHQWQHHGLVR